MADIALSIGIKILEYLVKPVLITPLRPIFCFKRIVDEFDTETTNLVAKRERVGNAMSQARKDVHEMGKNVHEWLKKTNEITEAGQKLERKLEAARNGIDCCSLGWTYRYCLSRQVRDHTEAIRKQNVTLEEARDLESHPMDLLQLVELPQNFFRSESASSALFQVTNALMDESVSKIGLHSMGGAGKTTLAKLVFKEAERSNVFKPIMVAVPQNLEITMAVRNIQGTIADFLGLPLEQEREDGRASKLRERLEDGEKILIILDDVVEELNLSQVGIPSSRTCKVLLTTNDPHVCGSTRTIELDNLYEEEAWALFKSTADVDDLLKSDDMTKKVLSYCSGLPKALVTVGGALRGTEPSSWEDRLQQLKNDRLKDVIDLQKEKDRLSRRRDNVQKEVEMAINNAQVIKKQVQTWLADAEKAVQSSEKLLVEAKENNSYSQEWHKVINNKALEQRTIVTDLREDGDAFVRVGDPAPIRQYMGLSSSEDFMVSESANSAFRDIMDSLGRDDCNKIGLYGMGGIGKTTLAKHVFKEVERSKMFDRVLMVTVSQSPAIGAIQQEIADFLSLQFEQGSEKGRAGKLNQRFQKEKFLIILDDVWKVFDLGDIGLFLEECKGCKILLTTRRLQVCNAMGCQTNIPLHLLSEDEAWDFFTKKAHLQDGSEMRDVAKQIVGECGKLPIALATVGSALKNKNTIYWVEALKKLRDVRLVDIPEVGDDDKNVYKCLRLSYDYLQHSKPVEAQFLLLLCSLFPEDSEIDVEDLTRCAFGMELFERVESVQDVRGEVKVAVQCLIDSCLLLETDEKRFVKVHDVVRDVALWIGGTESPGRTAFVVRDERDLSYLVKKESFRNCRALSFMAGSLSELSNCDPLKCPNLEAMLIFGGSEDVELPDTFFEHMKAIKVLNVRLWEKMGKPYVHGFTVPQSLQYLKNIQMLNFENCFCLNFEVVGELNNLKILSLAGSRLAGEVEAILLQRKELRLLDLRIRGSYGYHLSPNITANMIKLEEFLGACPADYDDEDDDQDDDDDKRSKHWWLSEVNSLEKLVTLTAFIMRQTCLPVGFCFQDMKSYNIKVGGKDYDEMTGYKKVVVLNHIKERSQLKAFERLFTTVEALELRFLYMGEEFTNNIIPSWVDAIGFAKPERFLQNMKELCVYHCEELKALFDLEGQSSNYVPQLQKLKLESLSELRHIWKGSDRFISQCNLTHVKIVECHRLTNIFSSAVCSAASLQQLQVLKIQKCDDLEDVISTSADGDEDFSCCFQNLRKLVVHDCRNLKAIFSMHTEMMPHPRLHLPKLQQINLQGNETLERVFAYGYAAESEQCPSLQELRVVDCPLLSFQASPIPKQVRSIELGSVTRVEAIIMQLQRPNENDDDQLSSLYLNNLPDLKCIWSDTKCSARFSHLTSIHVSRCNNLKQLFTVAMTPSLKQLKELCVMHCNKLEEIFMVDDLEEKGKEIPCDDLKFTISMTFPKLRELTMFSLPSLIRYCPATYNIVFPLLDIVIKGADPVRRKYDEKIW